MVDNSGTNGVQIIGNRNVILQKNDENIMGRSTRCVIDEDVFRRAGTERQIMKTITKRQIEFLGHAMTKEGFTELVLTERVNEKRSRGRQALTYLESFSKLLTEQVDDTKKPK